MHIPPGYGNLQLVWRMANGRDALSACGVSVEGVAPETLNAVAAAYEASEWQGTRCVSAVTLKLIRLIIGTSNPSAPITYELNVDIDGGNSDAGQQPTVSMLISKITNLGGRKGRGRSFLPGLSESAVNADGTLAGDVSGAIEDAEDFWTEMTAAVNSGTPYLLHSSAEDDPSEILRFSASTLVATQRRRLRG